MDLLGSSLCSSLDGSRVTLCTGLITCHWDNTLNSLLTALWIIPSSCRAVGKGQLQWVPFHWALWISFLQTGGLFLRSVCPSFLLNTRDLKGSRAFLSRASLFPVLTPALQHFSCLGFSSVSSALFPLSSAVARKVHMTLSLAPLVSLSPTVHYLCLQSYSFMYLWILSFLRSSKQGVYPSLLFHLHSIFSSEVSSLLWNMTYIERIP